MWLKMCEEEGRVGLIDARNAGDASRVRKGDQSLSVRKGQGTDQDAVDDREHGCRPTDAEREDEGRGDREHRSALEPPGRMIQLSCDV